MALIFTPLCLIGCTHGWGDLSWRLSHPRVGLKRAMEYLARPLMGTMFGSHRTVRGTRCFCGRLCQRWLMQCWRSLLKSRHKQTNIFHVVVLLRLMAPRWQRLFHKVCDFTFVASPGLTFWPTNMCKPLWVGIVLPFAHYCRPWSLERAPLLVEMEQDVRRVFETGDGYARNTLRKLLHLPKRLVPLSQRVACGVLHIPWGDQVPNARDH